MRWTALVPMLLFMIACGAAPCDAPDASVASGLPIDWNALHLTVRQASDASLNRGDAPIYVREITRANATDSALFDGVPAGGPYLVDLRAAAASGDACGAAVLRNVGDGCRIVLPLMLRAENCAVPLCLSDLRCNAQLCIENHCHVRCTAGAPDAGLCGCTGGVDCTSGVCTSATRECG